ncbi:MAG: PKD domain-containing protein, partial [Methanomicrobiales archaeon]|nr:PKD domain-containing protein [Methanomicrobiales archaeon]
VSYTLDEIGSFSEISWEFLPDQGNVGTMVDEFTVDPHFLAELTGVYVVRFSGTADIVSPANGEFKRLDFEQDVPVQVGDSPADIFVEGVEITQAAQIQEAVESMLYLSNEIVPLVEGKMTVIRVYPGVQNSSVSLDGVEALVEVETSGGSTFRPSPLWSSPTTTPTTSANLSPLISRRDNQTLSVNFLLMPWQAQGTVTVRATVNPGRKVKEMDYTNNRESMTVIFEEARPFNIHFIPVHYNRSGVDLTPVAAESAPLISYLRRTFPVPFTGKVNMWPVTQEINYSLVPDRGWKDLVGYVVILVGCNTGICAGSPGSLGPFPYGSDPHFYGLVPNGTPTCDMSGCNLGYGLYDHLAAAGLGGCAGVPGTCGPSLWAQDGGETFTHELAHNYNRRHAASPGGGEKQVDSNYRPVGGFIGDAGFDSERNLAIPRFNFDIMTYQSNLWIGPYTSRALFNKLEAGIAPGQGPNEPREFVEVSGIIEGTVGQETANILPLYRFMDRMDPVPPEPGHYAVELWNGSTATRLSQYSFEPREFSANLEVPGSFFLVFVPWVEGTDLVRVVRSGDTLAEIPVSPNPPFVAFTAPAPGTSLIGQQVIAWTAGDPDGDTLTSRIQYSADGGNSWRNVAVSLTEQVHLLDTSRLPGTDDAYLRVMVSDGVNTALATAGPFHVPPKIPLAVIAAGDDVIFPAGTGASIGGFAVDPEDGSVSGTGLTWTSDIDGPLGTGETFQASLLSPGVHRLTLTARDSSGMTGESSLTVTVLPTFTLPGQVELTVLATGPAGEPLEGTFRVVSAGRTIEDRTPLSVSVEAGAEVEAEAPAEIADGAGTLRFLRWERNGVPQGGRVIRFTADAVTDLTAVYQAVIPGFIVNAGVDATVDEGSPFTGSGSFTDPSSAAWIATVDYGDGSGVVPLALEDHAFSLGHTYGDNGVYTVTVTVTNVEGNTAADELTVTVLNVAPVVDAGLDAFLNQDVSLAGSGTFTDPGADTWTATVDYGDGTGIL